MWVELETYTAMWGEPHLHGAVIEPRRLASNESADGVYIEFCREYEGKQGFYTNRRRFKDSKKLSDTLATEGNEFYEGMLGDTFNEMTKTTTWDTGFGAELQVRLIARWTYFTALASGRECARVTWLAPFLNWFLSTVTVLAGVAARGRLSSVVPSATHTPRTIGVWVRVCCRALYRCHQDSQPFVCVHC